MNRILALTLILSSLILVPTNAQQRVDPLNTGHRMLAIVPIIGKGTFDDPRRPMYVPSLADPSVLSRSGIIAHAFVESDDGKLALVEFVAADPAAFKDVLANNTVTAFAKGSGRLDAVIAEFKKHKKDFDINKFGVRMQ